MVSAKCVFDVTQVKNYDQEQGKIWLIGGTTESRLIAQAIEQSGFSAVITVATPTAKNLYPAWFDVRIGCMDLQTMPKFCLTEKIIALIDASHPYAVEVSQNAIATAKANNIPYLRYERPLVQLSAVRPIPSKTRNTQAHRISYQFVLMADS